VGQDQVGKLFERVSGIQVVNHVFGHVLGGKKSGAFLREL